MKTNLTLIVVLVICGWFAYQNMSSKQVAHVDDARTEVAAVIVQAANVVSPSTNTISAIVPTPERVAEVVAPAPVPPKDWTVAGRDYHNVTVTKVEDDCVRVTYDGGAGSIMLADMLPDLRKYFRYDAVAAQAAAEAKEAARNAAIAAMPAPEAIPAIVSPPQAVLSLVTAPPISSATRSSIQGQIDALNQDIAQKQSEVDRNAQNELRHSTSSQNAYRDIIAREQQEVAALTQQLTQ